jgi:dTDP-4-dehydrorhamnose reductase
MRERESSRTAVCDGARDTHRQEDEVMTHPGGIDQRSVLLTGGTGLLGRAIKLLLPDAYSPTSTECDVRSVEQVTRIMQGRNLSTVIHAAAITSPPRVDQSPWLALETNIVGTANVVHACREHALRLLYISTDYVFRGDRGPYSETDAVFPVNKYAWSKLGGECAVRLYENALIIRTSFGPDVFPYPQAMVDQWTSRESVSRIAAKIVGLLNSTATGVVHVGGARRSVWEYATSLDEGRSEIQKISIQDLPFAVPADTSLRTDRYDDILRDTATAGHHGD